MAQPSNPKVGDNPTTDDNLGKWKKLDEAQKNIFADLDSGGGEGIHLYPHVSLHKLNGEIDIKDHTFFRLFGCNPDRVTLGKNTTTFFRDKCKVKLLKGGFSCYVRFEDAEINDIDGLDTAIVLIEGCNIERLKIQGCKNTTFYITGGVNHMSSFISNNKKCSFILNDVVIDTGYGIQKNEDCTVWFLDSKSGCPVLLDNNVNLVLESNNFTVTSRTADAQNEDKLYFIFHESTLNGGENDKGIQTDADSALIFVNSTVDTSTLANVKDTSLSFHDTTVKTVQDTIIAERASILVNLGKFESQKSNLVGSELFIFLSNAQIQAQDINFKFERSGLRSKASKVTTSAANNANGSEIYFWNVYESEFSSTGANVDGAELYSIFSRKSDYKGSGQNIKSHKVYSTTLYKNQFGNKLSGIRYLGPPGQPEIPIYLEIQNRSLQLNNQYGPNRPAPPKVPEGGEPPPNPAAPSGPTPNDCEVYKKAVMAHGFKWVEGKINIIGVRKSDNLNFPRQSYPDELILCGPGVFEKFPCTTTPGQAGAARLTVNQQVSYVKRLHHGHPALGQNTPVKLGPLGPASVNPSWGGFNIHAGGPAGSLVGNWSLGCQVIVSDHRWGGAHYKKFLELTYYRAGQEVFLYTLLPASALAS